VIWDFTRGQDKIEIDSSIAKSFADFRLDDLESKWVAGGFAIKVHFTVGGGFKLTADDFVFVNTINGTDRVDVIRGTAGNDTVYAKGGNDFVYGNNGDDRLFGGDGNDWLEGNAGNDTLLGNNGDDRLFGGDGNDRLEGGEGLDWLKGNAGNDTLLGGAGKDILFGGDGNDQLTGGEGRDWLYGDLDSTGVFTGKDTFVFNTKADSPADTPDVIWDFTRGHDKIQIATSSGIKSFSDFNKVGSTWVAGDFAITVYTVQTLDASDFQFV
jgi:Ca2+-binding RTX toxin-like protein